MLEEFEKVFSRYNVCSTHRLYKESILPILIFFLAQHIMKKSRRLCLIEIELLHIEMNVFDIVVSVEYDKQLLRECSKEMKNLPSVKTFISLLRCRMIFLRGKHFLYFIHHHAKTFNIFVIGNPENNNYYHII